MRSELTPEGQWDKARLLFDVPESIDNIMEQYFEDAEQDKWEALALILMKLKESDTKVAKLENEITMNEQNLREQFEKETGESSHSFGCEDEGNFTDKYVEWLEKRILPKTKYKKAEFKEYKHKPTFSKKALQYDGTEEMAVTIVHKMKIGGIIRNPDWTFHEFVVGYRTVYAGDYLVDNGEISVMSRKDFDSQYEV